MYANILKYNENHDKTGRFATHNGGPAGLPKPGKAGKAKHTPASVQNDFVALQARGVKLPKDIEAYAKTWHDASPNVSPSELMDGMLGKGAKVESGEFQLSNKFIIFTATNAEFHGAKATKVTRSFDFKHGVVAHKTLVIEKSAQGAGTVKKMFTEGVPLYQKMGMKKINAYANMDAGAYAWARYGFDADEPKKYATLAGKSIRSAKPKKMSDAEKAEHDALLKIVEEHKGRADLPSILTAAQTPHLTTRVKADGSAKPNFLAHAFDNTEWDGHLKLDDARQMKHLSKYVGKTLKPSKPPAA